MPETRVRHGSSMGQPVPRREGFLKVTGGATYAADNHPAGMLHAVLCVAGIAKGRVTHLDVAAAKAHPGVVEVMTPENAPKLVKHPDVKEGRFDFKLDLLQDDRVRYAHQSIAVVIGTTLEAAQEGVALLAPRYEVEQARIGLDGATFEPEAIGPGMPPTAGTGDVAGGLAEAARRVETVVETPPQYHNAMEPHAMVARWDGDALHLDTPSQGMPIAQARLAGLFGLKPENIHIVTPFLGGGFGSKGMIAGPQVLCVMAAKMMGRPVKLVLRREQMYGPVGHRGATRQTVKLGADADGALTAIDHHTVAPSSSYDLFIEPAGTITRHLYAAPAISTTHVGVRNDVGTPTFMRAPGEAPGSLALEIAMDELADQYGMDPVEFRLKNYAEVEPITGKPFSSKQLRECYRIGAERFGWKNRPLEPRRMRDSDGLLVGWGMGTALFPANQFPGAAKAILRADGSARVECGSHDMGQGAWTALSQIAADAMGVGYGAIDFDMGHSELPGTTITGGSGGTATAGLAIYVAGQDVVRQLGALATRDERSPLFGAGNAGLMLHGGRLVRQDDESRGEAVTAIMARAGVAEIAGKGESGPDQAIAKTFALCAHGAVFAEVKVDPDLGQVRCTRLVGAFATGRIVNPRMVDSQLKGGMIWGVSFALHEHAAFDRRSGRPMNPNLGEYHVPVNADIPHVEAISVEEDDPHVNPLGIKGVGEIGITGTAGAVANAVWHATGVRVRETPITLDKLL